MPRLLTPDLGRLSVPLIPTARLSASDTVGTAVRESAARCHPLIVSSIRSLSRRSAVSAVVTGSYLGSDNNPNQLSRNDLCGRASHKLGCLDHHGGYGMELLNRIAPLASHLQSERLSQALSIPDRAPAGQRRPSTRSPGSTSKSFQPSEVTGERHPDDPP
jgi:hypothetical protein